MFWQELQDDVEFERDMNRDLAVYLDRVQSENEQLRSRLGAHADADSHEQSPWFWTAALGVAGIIILAVVVARVGPAIRVSKILTSLASGLSASWIAMRSRSANRFVPVD